MISRTRRAPSTSCKTTLSYRASADERLSSTVLSGLQASPKRLSPIWFYDEAGSALFDRISELPEYYVTRAEIEIMRSHAQEMAGLIGPDAALIEYGSGSSLKTRILLDALVSAFVYVPVDISRAHLQRAADALALDYPRVSVEPLCADFTAEIELPPLVRAASRRIVYFPGSTIGNFERADAIQLLRAIRGIIEPGGAALIGVDLRKSVDVLLRAYDDSQGVTAAFNRNSLRHLNRILNADFDVSVFEHRACWSECDSRIEMHLVSQIPQVIRIDGVSVWFARGESLVTEYSHKYSLQSFAQLAGGAGLHIQTIWTDKAEQFSVQLLLPSSESRVSR